MITMESHASRRLRRRGYNSNEAGPFLFSTSYAKETKWDDKKVIEARKVRLGRLYHLLFTRSPNQRIHVQVAILAALLICFLLLSDSPERVRTRLRLKHERSLYTDPLSLRSSSALMAQIQFLSLQRSQIERIATAVSVPQLGDFRKDQQPHYGSVNVENQYGSGVPREIHEEDSSRYAERRRDELSVMDIKPHGLDEYYLNEEDVDPDEECRRNNWRSLRFQNCNTFHEQSMSRTPDSNLQLYNVTYRGHGSFRHSWHFRSLHRHRGDDFILKALRYRSDFDYKAMAEMNNEAIVLERLTGSPRIVDIFGHCGVSIVAEIMEFELTKEIIPGSEIDYSTYGYMNQSALDALQTTDVHPMNDLNSEQKLQYAVVMAESIADIHGYVGGVIVHGDIHPVQWLKNKLGLIKLNDFNNGEVMKFDVSKQEYCDLYRCYGGTYRPPEELMCGDLYSNEKVDVWPMGNNIYCLLTGLWPYYQYGNQQDREVIRRIRHCEKPFVDDRYRNRSFIESGLVRIMEKTWECDYQKRVSIFEVVQELHKLRDRYEALSRRQK